VPFISKNKVTVLDDIAASRGGVFFCGLIFLLPVYFNTTIRFANLKIPDAILNLSGSLSSKKMVNHSPFRPKVLF
jgi:hypothetical protein